MNTAISRRAVVGGLALSPTIFIRGAWAQGKELRIGIQGGLQGEFIRKNVIPKFESDFGCRVLAEEGNTLGQIARLRATKESPRYTVVPVDDLGVEIAKREDLIDRLPVDLIPNLAKVFPNFIYEGGFGVGHAISSVGLFYNTKTIKPLASYAEMWEPRFAKRIMLSSAKGTPSVYLLIVCAAIATGKPYAEAQYLIDEAWPKLEELKPNVINLYVSDTAALNVAQGEADLGGLEHSKYVVPYALKGANVEMCYPKEGAFAGVNCQVLVKNAPNRELGAEWMNRILSPEVQKPLAEATLAAPSIEGLSFGPELAKVISYPLSKMNEMNLFSPDWAHVNANRSAWIEKINQIFTT